METVPTSQQPQSKRSVWASRRTPEEGWDNGVFVLMPDFIDALQRDILASFSNPVPLVDDDAADITSSAAASKPAMRFRWSPVTLSLLKRTVEASTNGSDTGAHPISDS